MWRYRLPVSPGYGLNTLMVILIALFVVGIIVAILWSRRNQTDWEDQHEEANRKARSAAPPTAETKNMTEEDLRKAQREEQLRRTKTLEEALAEQERNRK